MLLDFEKYAMKGNEFMHLLEDNLGVKDRAHAGRILRSTFRVLRNHISFQESLQLISQLPMAIKSIYVDGWQYNHRTPIKNTNDFLVEIVNEDGEAAWRDFGSQSEIIDCVRAVIDTMRLYVSEEEMNQAIGTLPRKIQDLFAVADY